MAKTTKTIRAATTPTIRDGLKSQEGVTTQIASSEVVGPFIESRQTIEMFESTIFDAFDLSIEVVYNFFTPDEETVPSGTGALSEIPRYVKLSWRRAPTSFVSTEKQTKGRKNSQTKSKMIDSSGASYDLSEVSSVEKARTVVANGFLSPGTLRADVSSPMKRRTEKKLDQELFLLSDDTVGMRASSVKSESLEKSASSTIDHMMRDVIPSPETRFKVSFIDPGLAGAFDEKRVGVVDDASHVTSLASLSHIISSAEVISSVNQIKRQTKNVPEMPSHPDLFGVQYIGYLIERFIVTDTGMMLDASIAIDGSTEDRYDDRDVLYGKTYSYRIRAIVRWTRQSDVNFFNQDQEKFGKFARSYVCSFYNGDWSQWNTVSVIETEEPQPPDELTVRTVSRKGYASIAWKIPEDKRRDLSEFIVYKKTRTAGSDTSEWNELKRVASKNGQIFDTDVPYSEDAPDDDVVYTMISKTVHGLSSRLGEQIACRLTRNPDAGENPLKMVSLPGASMTSTGDLSIVPHRSERSLIKSRKSVNVTIRDDSGSFPLFKEYYVLRLISSVTGETVDVPLTILTEDVIPRPKMTRSSSVQRRTAK